MVGKTLRIISLWSMETYWSLDTKVNRGFTSSWYLIRLNSKSNVEEVGSDDVVETLDNMPRSRKTTEKTRSSPRKRTRTQGTTDAKTSEFRMSSGDGSIVYMMIWIHWFNMFFLSSDFVHYSFEFDVTRQVKSVQKKLVEARLPPGDHQHRQLTVLDQKSHSL